MSRQKKSAKIKYNIIQLLKSTIILSLFFVFFAGTASAANTDFTISAWVKRQGATTTMAIVAKENEVRLVTDASNQVACQIYDGSAWQGFATSSVALSANEWTFTTCVYSGSSLNIYINGIEKASVSESSTVNDTTNVFRIGSDASGDYNDFVGYIDEVKIYPYARSADQIKQDYNAGLSGVSTDKGASISFGGSSDKWLSDDLVGYWKMDETATTSGAIDASGNGNDGVYYGNASTTGGKFGNGGVFDGSGDYIKINQTIFDENYSLSVWLKYDSIVSNKIFMGYIDTFSDYIIFSDSTTITVHDYGNNDLDWTVPAMSSGNWYHVMITKDNDSNWRLYLNGKESSTGKINSETQLYINGFGRGYSDGSWSWDGQIDEVRIYNRALSKSEVRKLYEWAPGPVLHLKMDEKNGTTAYDTSGNDNNGTLINDPVWARGKFGSTLNFNGIDEYLDIGTVDDKKPNAYTLLLWLDGERGQSVGGLLMGGGGSSNRWGLSLESGGQIVSKISDGSNYSNWYIENYDLSNYPTGWHYITLVNDGSVSNFYRDGVYVSQNVNSRVNKGSLNVTFDVARGGTTWESYFNGKIDDVKFYNYARTQKQILEDMNGGGPAVKSPVLHFSFDEGYGETVHDSSVYGNDGTAYVGTGGTQTATSSMWEKSGRIKGGIELDGTDDYVGIPDFDY